MSAVIRLLDGRVYEAGDAQVNGRTVQAVARVRVPRGLRTERRYTYGTPRRYLWPLHRVADIVWNDEVAA